MTRSEFRELRRSTGAVMDDSILYDLDDGEIREVAFNDALCEYFYLCYLQDGVIK